MKRYEGFQTDPTEQQLLHVFPTADSNLESCTPRYAAYFSRTAHVIRGGGVVYGSVYTYDSSSTAQLHNRCLSAKVRYLYMIFSTPQTFQQCHIKPLALLLPSALSCAMETRVL